MSEICPIKYERNYYGRSRNDSEVSGGGVWRARSYIMTIRNHFGFRNV